MYQMNSSHDVNVIDTATNTSSTSIKVGENPRGVGGPRPTANACTLSANVHRAVYVVEYETNSELLILKWVNAVGILFCRWQENVRWVALKRSKKVRGLIRYECGDEIDPARR